MITSESEEELASVEAWQLILDSERQTTNVQHLNAVQRVSNEIARVANKPNYNWEFKVFESNDANAFCLPGGKIGVYTGLFAFTANDAELAAVIGHEVGHAIARHGGERMSQEKLKDYGSTLIGFAFEGYGATIASSAFGLGAEYGAILPYGREHEYEADMIGMQLMIKAGYNPYSAISFWEKFATLSQTNEFQEFFSTHPMSEKRIINLKNYLPGAISTYKAATKKHNYGTIY